MGELLNYVAPNVNNLVDHFCTSEAGPVLSHGDAEDAELAEFEAYSGAINTAFEAAAAGAEEDGSIREDVFRGIEQKLAEARARFRKRVIRPRLVDKI
jgi:hypothetical protein